MNNNLRNEMIVLLSNHEPQVLDDDQVKILANCSKFVNSTLYMDGIKKALDVFFFDDPAVNLWVELPKIINVIIDFNKNVDAMTKDIKVDYMKFIIYAVIYSYLDSSKPELLDDNNRGNLRIGFLNILNILFTDAKKILVKKQTIWSALMQCVCGDNGKIKI